MSFHWESTIISIIAFGLLYWLLNKYAFGPLFGIMEKRREIVLGELEAAEANRKESERLLAEQRQALEEARREAQEIIETARRTSQKQAEEIIQAAREEANRLKNEALREIQNEKNNAIAALRRQVSGLSVQIASKILERQIDEKAHEQLVEQYLKEVGKTS